MAAMRSRAKYRIEFFLNFDQIQAFCVVELRLNDRLSQLMSEALELLSNTIGRFFFGAVTLVTDSHRHNGIAHDLLRYKIRISFNCSWLHNAIGLCIS